MDGLDETLAGILAGMRALPPAVAREVAGRLPDIVTAITADILDEAAIVLPVTDLQDERVVLSITIRRHAAHLDVSTEDDATVISNGYDLRMADGRTDVTVDEDLRLTEIDHADLLGRHLETRRATDMVEEARRLMATHAAFAPRDREGR